MSLLRRVQAHEPNVGPPVNRLRIAALDPANEAAHVNPAGECRKIFALACLGGMLVLRPLRHQALQTGQIDEAARQRRTFEPFEIAGHLSSSLTEDPVPCHPVDAATALLDDLAWQTIGEDL